MDDNSYRYKTQLKEINQLKRDIFITYRSNSQSHYQDIASYNYDHRIRLNPSGETTTMDIRNQIPVTHITDNIVKSEFSAIRKNKKKTAYEKAEVEGNINNQLNKQKHQNLLEKEKNLKKLFHKVYSIKQKKLDNKKLKLKGELTRIIKNALLFSKKNSAVRAMLPDNINEVVENVKKETQNISLNISRISAISKVSSIGMFSSLEKNEFLNSLGIDMENLNANNVNIDIDKCWNYIVKIAKGKKIEDILRYKVVNVIMNLVEKKSAEKARKIYEKLEIYKKYMDGKKRLEKRRKKLEEQKRENELKSNIKEYIKQKMYKSLSEPKLFKNENNNKYDRLTGNKKYKKKDKNLKKGESAKTNAQGKEKKFIRFNSYNDVTKIIQFIDTSKNNSQSKFCKEHFENIKITKNMDKSLKKMIEKNYIFK